jgi:hypothetical protein
VILLNPIWLFALAALSIPVAIHLWHIRPGKTLKVGSISLINSSSQNSRSIKLHDLLLLLLRCLLLALLALVLTLPLRKKQISSSSIKGWVLIPSENLKESYQKFKPEVDSLTKAGYEFHYFDQGFQKAVLSEALADGKNLKKDSSNAASYWTLLEQLDGQIPSSLPVYLFTSNRATHFKGEKPQIALNLHWKTYSLADSTNTWLAKAWLSDNNDIQVVQGNSKASGIYFINYSIKSGDQRNANFTVNTENGKLTVSQKGSNQVTVDTTTWRFAIYAEKNSADANYVKAALSSIVQFTKHKAVIRQYADAVQIPLHQNWVFWLSAKPVTVRHFDNLFSYEAGKIRYNNSWINDKSGALFQQKIGSYKSVVAANKNAVNLWNDGFGDSILSLEKQGQNNFYHFYSRFDPSWSDLVWSDDFPKMLLRLIIGPTSKPDISNDKRVVDNRQILPVADHEAHVSTNSINEKIDLSRYLWLLMVIVFIAERWLAHRQSVRVTAKPILQNG